MPKLTEDQIVTQGHKRLFLQWGGARPNNPLYFAGLDGQDGIITAGTLPNIGDINPINVPDPRKPNAFVQRGRTRGAPGLPTATLQLLERHGAVPRLVGKEDCGLAAYLVTGNCKDLSDFDNGPTDYVEIYSGGLISQVNLGARQAWDASAQITDEASLTLADLYAVGALNFGEQGATQVLAEVVDIAYFNRSNCGDCGPANDGSQWIYGVQLNSAGPVAATVVYSVDGGLTWTTAAITGIGNTDAPTAIAIVGDKLVVLVKADNAYYYATINLDTGVPGTFTKVSTAFTASKVANDVYVFSPREVYWAGDGGYLYKSTDITVAPSIINAGAATTQNLLRINGVDETIVAVGAAGAVVKSDNRGGSFAVKTVPVAATLQALAVLDRNRLWVGTATGRSYYSMNGGASWSERVFSGSSAGQVRDIVFATEEIGYMSHDTATPTARIFCTMNGGLTWVQDGFRVNGLPTFNRAARLAVPEVDNAKIKVNNLMVAGLGGGGSDGILVVGRAAMV